MHLKAVCPWHGNYSKTALCRCKSIGWKFLYIKGYLFRMIYKVKNAVFQRYMFFGFVFLTFYCGYIKRDLIKLLFTGFHFTINMLTQIYN